MPTSTPCWRVYKMTGSISSFPSPLLPCIHHPLPAAADAPPPPLPPVGPPAPHGVPHPGCSLPGKQDGRTQPCHHLCPNPFPLLKVCELLSSCKPLHACDHKKAGLYLYWYRYRYRCLYSWYRHSIGMGKLITYTLPIPIIASST